MLLKWYVKDSYSILKHEELLCHLKCQCVSGQAEKYTRKVVITLANYHLEVSIISRKKGRSVTKLANYISGQKLHDSYTGKNHYKRRSDVLYSKVLLPADAPTEFYNIQYLCNKIDEAEKRCDARTAREIKASLPNELSKEENIRIVNKFVARNILRRGLGAIVAIHEGRNEEAPEKNNPHVHIIITTRQITSDGFSRKKDRSIDKKAVLTRWREAWMEEQNHAYERNWLDIEISHASLKAQGIDRIPKKHISRIDFQKKQRLEQLLAKSKKRVIDLRHQKEGLKNQYEHEKGLYMSRSR